LIYILDNSDFSEDIITTRFEEIIQYSNEKIMYLFLRRYTYLYNRSAEYVLYNGFEIRHSPAFYDWLIYRSGFSGKKISEKKYIPLHGIALY
jgi:hypothetical protein